MASNAPRWVGAFVQPERVLSRDHAANTSYQRQSTDTVQNVFLRCTTPVTLIVRDRPADDACRKQTGFDHARGVYTHFVCSEHRDFCTTCENCVTAALESYKKHARRAKLSPSRFLRSRVFRRLGARCKSIWKNTRCKCIHWQQSIKVLQNAAKIK